MRIVWINIYKLLRRCQVLCVKKVKALEKEGFELRMGSLWNLQREGWGTPGFENLAGVSRKKERRISKREGSWRKKKKTKQRVNNQVGILEPSCRTHYGGLGARGAPTSPVDNRGDLRCGCRYWRQHRAFYAVKQGDNISGAWELTGHGWWVGRTGETSQVGLAEKLGEPLCPTSSAGLASSVMGMGGFLSATICSELLITQTLTLCASAHDALRNILRSFFMFFMWDLKPGSWIPTQLTILTF